jgi:2-methylisocitrate lyase-like PEP mutase family enzyme
MTGTHASLARLFHSLHHGSDPIVLPNVWDVASARIVQRAGAKALATTSAGVAWSIGAPDGGALGRDRALAVVARVVAAVDVPVTVDIEDGYADTPAGVATTVAGVVAAGAVGVNLEDAAPDGGDPFTLRDVHAQCERIAAARAAADAAGVPLYLNARVDTYLRGVGEPGDRLVETVERAREYVRSGADGVFVPGVIDGALISELVWRIPAPLNIMAAPKAPTVKELAAIGVARVSLGPAIAQAAYAVVRDAAAEMLDHGTYNATRHGLDFAELNSLLAT